MTCCHAAAGMLAVYNDQRCTDLTLLVENERLPAHKVVLIARSPFFAAMFAHEENAEFNKKEVGDIITNKRTVQIELHAVSARGMRAALQFMYTDRVDDIGEVAGDTLVAADQ